MVRIDDLLPEPPSWSLDWRGIDAAFSWIRRLRDRAQDPVHHAEGDVWIHTKCVAEEIAGSAEYRASDEVDRRVAFAAALLHDVQAG